MKKKIFSLVGALVLTCAMSLNVFAADSPEAVKEAAGGVDVPTSCEELTQSCDLAKKIIDFDESDVTVTALTTEAVMPIAQALARMNSESAVERVDVVAVFELDGIPGKVVVNVQSTDIQTVYAIHVKEDGEVERVLGDKSGDKVTFNFTSFSPVAIVKVTQKANPAPQSSDNNNTATTQAAAVTPPATTMINGMTVPAAPKTGDAVIPVAVMAVIFMVGAAVAVSRKRA